MSVFSQAIPFEEAIDSHAVRTLLGTTLNSREMRAVIDALPEAIRRRIFFSAQVAQYDILEPFFNAAGNQLDRQPGAQDLRTFLRNQLADRGYKPEAGLEGTVEDLSSFKRLNVMLETNMDIALGYGQYVQSNNADVIDDFPAWELFRAEDRFRPRGDPEYKGDAAIGWESRWEQAGAAAGDDDALRMLNEFSRMVALKSSAIWNHLGDDWQDSLGNPFPPFAWGSGMDTEEISRSEGEALGLLESGDTVEPRDIPDLNDTLEAPIETRDQQLLDALLKSLPDDTELKNGILTLKGEGGMLFNNERDSIRASSADFDESLHPRVPAGSPEGGEFTSGGENAHGFTDNGDQTATLRGHTVVRETEKALLLRTKTGSEAWVPKSQMTVEGDKVNMPHWVASKFQPTLHVFKPEFPVGETDKAWKLRVSVERMDGEPETATVFLPKSQVSRTADGALKAPRWLLDAKEAEISDRSTGRTGLLW